MKNLIAVDIWKAKRTKQAVIEFSSLEFDNDEDAVMCSEDNI